MARVSYGGALELRTLATLDDVGSFLLRLL